jgi:hypothetical protein
VVRIVETALRRALNWENGSDHDSVPRLRIRARSGRWLTLYASLAKTDSGVNETMIVIEPSKPEEVA